MQASPRLTSPASPATLPFMRCPKRAHDDDKVIDSRSIRNGDVIRRRRVCSQCGHRFTTYEEVVKTVLTVL